MRKEIVILAAVALGSMAIGFLVVLLVLGPGESRTLPDPFADRDTAAATGPGGETSPVDSTMQKGQGKQVPAGDGPSQAERKPGGPAAPPGKEVTTVLAPGRLAMEIGDPFVWRCWAEGQSDPMEKGTCGALPGVEKLVEDNLGVIEDCVLDHAGEKASGKLSLALKLDFSGGKVKAWLGNSTTVAEMESISACLRTGFDDKVVPPLEHDHPRYIVFFTITVG